MQGWHQRYRTVENILILTQLVGSGATTSLKSTASSSSSTAPDFERFSEAKAELDALLSIEELAKVPFLVLGNKIDAPGAVSEEELRHHLGLYQTTGKVRSLAMVYWAVLIRSFVQGKVPLTDIRPVELFMCSVVQRQGYGEGSVRIVLLSQL